MRFSTEAHAYETRSTAMWAVAILTVVAFLAIALTGPQVAKAATVQPAFPHLATWWPDADAQSDAKLANCDYVALQNWDAGHIAGLRAANPSLIILGYTDARELNYVIGDYNNAVNVVLRTASPDWVLTQVGSTLTSAITNSTTTIPVADATKFAVGEMVLVDQEYLHITAISGSNLTVSPRPTVNPAAAHASGTRIASLVTSWPGTVTFDLSTNCPKRDVGYGLETWSGWNVRRGVSVLNSADWDGLLIDCLESNASWMVGPGRNRSIDPLRTNVPVTDNYAAFNTAWNNGAVAYGNNLKTASGNKMLIGNGNMRNFNMNGNVFEEFPYTGLAANVWDIVIPGPYGTPHASYADWCANSASPNLTLMQTYGSDTDYQLMRFGLTTALMNNGYFSYAPSSSVHSHNGLSWFDEYDNAGAGRGYLGQPTAAAVKVGNAYRRDFDKGVALVNPSASAVTVQLGGTFRKIHGTQAPTVNDGSLVTAVTLQPQDGIVLLRVPAVVTYTLTYSATSGGTITGNAAQTVNSGASGTAVTAVAASGYHFVNWSDGVTSAARTDANVTANKSVTANFAITPVVTYTLTYSATSGGTITGSAAQTVNSGASGTAVTAVAASGYHFVNWSDGSTSANRTDANVTANLAVTANFAVTPAPPVGTYSLTYSATSGGTITGSAAQTVNSGASGTAVTAVAASGYHFVNWSDGVTSAARTDANVTADLAVTANFAVTPAPPVVTYTLTYSATSGGTITGSAAQTVNSGASGTAVTAVAASGYHFVNWSDGVTSATRTDGNCTASKSVTANFAVTSSGSTTTRLSGPSRGRVRRTSTFVGTVSTIAVQSSLVQAADVSLTSTASADATPVQPAGPSRVRITKSRLINGKWKVTGSFIVKVVNGKFSYNFKPAHKSSYRFVATAIGSDTVSKSAAKTLKVK